MNELLKVNLRAHFLYYRRSRLLLGFALVFLLLVLLTALPAVFSPSRTEAFTTAKKVFTTLNMYLIAFSAGLGLFLVSSHLHDRNLKMVFTKPCPPTLWLGSAYLSAIAVSLLVNAAILACALGMSLLGHTKVQAGLTFISLDTFAASLGMIAYLMFLAMVIHPIIAAVIVLVFNPSTFYALQLWTLAVYSAGHKSVFLHALERLFHYCYMALPMVHPFSRETQGIEESLRVAPAQWPYALYSLGYALSLTALSYCLSVFFLQRKKLI
jgi:lysylphosphatidylglycerol synthetase-like protein (DUF2156 family)